MPSGDDGNQLASSFEIRELTGDQRTLTLRGRALPYRPFTLSGKQRNSVEWYPGNPIGVMQVYGAEEEGTTINGMWKDVFLGDPSTIKSPYATVNGTALTTARDLAELVDDIRRKGQEIVVTWMSFTRFGILDRFTQKWQTGHDVEYDILFTWISQEDITLTNDVPFTSDNAAADLTSVPDEVQDQLDQITAPTQNLVDEGITTGGAINGFTTAFDPQYQPIVDDIDDVISDIQSQSDDLANSIAMVASIATATSDAQRRLAGVLNGIKINALSCRELLGQVDGARMNLGGTFGSVLTDRSSSRQQAVIAANIQVIAAAQEAKIIRAITSQVLAVFTARGGDSLRTVSNIYYGTPDNWRDLMLYNNFDDEMLVAGQVVIVPLRLPSATS